MKNGRIEPIDPFKAIIEYKFKKGSIRFKFHPVRTITKAQGKKITVLSIDQGSHTGILLSHDENTIELRTTDSDEWKDSILIQKDKILGWIFSPDNFFKSSSWRNRENK